MANRYPIRKTYWLLILPLLLALAGCRGEQAYEATFDNAGNWSVGDDAFAEGGVQNGVYELYVKANASLTWATADQDNLGNGSYEIQATQTEGPLDNGYGLMFRLDNENNNFYLFEVSGDGYVWIGWCESSCSAIEDTIVDEDWIPSDAVRQGLNSTNTLRVNVNGANMQFYVNGTLVGEAFDDRANERGDIGLAVETLGVGGVRVIFDNFKYTPTQTE